MRGFSSVDLQSNEALGSEMIVILLFEISPGYSVEPCLDSSAITFDDDCIPVLPAKELSPPDGEGCGGIPSCELAGEEPPATRFLVDSGSVGAFVVIVVLTLVSKYSSSFVALLRAELAARISGAIHELKLEGEDEVAIGLVRAKECISPDVFPMSDNSAICHLVFCSSPSFSPTGQGPSIKERDVSVLQEGGSVGAKGWLN